MEDCLFCKIAAHEIDADIVYEDSECVVFRDIAPEARVHLLVIPKTHIASAQEPEADAVIAHLLSAVRTVAEAEGIDTSGYRIVTNVGKDAGQSVHHLHLHVLGGQELNAHVNP